MFDMPSNTQIEKRQQEHLCFLAMREEMMFQKKNSHLEKSIF